MQAAVEREDYELAKQIKIDADRLRAAGEAAAGTAGHSPGRLCSHPEEIFNRVLQPQLGKAISPPNKGSIFTQPGTLTLHMQLFSPASRMLPWPLHSMVLCESSVDCLQMETRTQQITFLSGPLTATRLAWSSGHKMVHRMKTCLQWQLQCTHMKGKNL